MKAPVDIIFPPVPPDRVPYWRRGLRGCSQLCFQSNELTGLFFLAALLIVSPIASAYFLVAAMLAPGARWLLGDRGAVLGTGMPGLNPCLIALSLTGSFETGWTNFAMWGVLVACVAVTVVLTRLFLAVLPFPVLALPSVLTYWGLFALEPSLGFLEWRDLPSLADPEFEPVKLVLLNLAQVLLSTDYWSGVLFLIGMYLSNWRHATVALLAAIIGTLASNCFYTMINPASLTVTLMGFNAILTAVAVYATGGGKLSLAILGTLVAIVMTSVFGLVDLPTLSAPYVLSTWIVLALVWIDTHCFTEPETAEPDVSTPAGTGN